MAEAEDYHPLQSKRKAISALLPYAIWQDRDGRPEMLVAILHVVRISKMQPFVWHHIRPFVGTLVSDASPNAVVLMSPHLFRDSTKDKEGLVQRWVAATSAATYTEEVGQSVVDMLLQIASEDKLVPYIPADLWSWLTKRPSLPPICRGRFLGTRGSIVEVVRALKDTEVLKSYLLLVWSEWDYLYDGGFYKMCTSIREDFGRNGMGHHRVDLIQRLDHVLEQIDHGPEHPAQRDFRMWGKKDQYQKLRETLLEINIEAIARTPHLTIMPL